MSPLADTTPAAGAPPIGGPSAHRPVWVAPVLALVLGAMVVAVVSLTPRGLPAPTAGVGTLSEPAVAAADSGRIGAWQQLGHAHAAHDIAQRAAKDPRGVLLLGDSMASRVRPVLAPMLTSRQRSVTWDHWNGRPTHGSVDALAALDGQGLQPRTIVVLSGSNDVFEPGALTPQIERLLRMTGPHRQIYWVVPRVERPSWREADLHNSGLVEEALTSAASRHTNLHLVPWGRHLAGRSAHERTAFAPDGVHPSAAGVTALNELILEHLARG